MKLRSLKTRPASRNDTDKVDADTRREISALKKGRRENVSALLLDHTLPACAGRLDAEDRPAEPLGQRLQGDAAEMRISRGI